MATTTGFWEGLGAPAAVDWCEPNYVHSHYVAEWWNTLTSLVIFAVGAYGLWRWFRARDKLEPRFAVCYLALAVIGLGSAAFHATLLKLPQATDELPMVWLSLVCAYCLVTRRGGVDAARRRRWGWGLTAYAAVFTAGYFAFADYFVLFLATYASIVAYVCIITWRIAYREIKTPRHKRFFWWSVGAYVGGLVVFWIPERALGCDHGYQLIQPHAWFHLTSVVGTYSWILLATLDRVLRVGATPTVTRRPIPFVAAE